MKRWLLLIICLAGGAIALFLGLLVPVHLRAIDRPVLERAGIKTPGLAEYAGALELDGNHGAADLVLQAARLSGITNHGNLPAGLDALAARGPRVVAWGMPDSRLEALFWADPKLTNAVPQPLSDILLRLENRGKVLSYLRVSPRPVILELLRTRSLTNTVLFPPSSSASGQAYDAAINVCGMLLDRAQLSTKLTERIHALAVRANQGKPEPLEEVLLDLLALGQRLNFGQIVVFLAKVDDPPTLHTLAALSRTWEKELPLLFAAVHISGLPAQTALYASRYPAEAPKAFALVLPLKAGALKEMLDRDKIYNEPLLQKWAANWPLAGDFVRGTAEYAWLLPRITMVLKGLLYLAGGFLLALGFHFGRPRPSPLEKPLQVPGFHYARESLFAVGFLLFIILLNEPFLTQQPQKPEVQIRLRIPSVSAIVPAGKPVIQSLMMTRSLLTLLLFFVLQALLYTACLMKLAEIRRQQVPASTRLKLLDNEEHLFDAGLYLGFAGTIVSLILVSMGIAALSLMAAYSSTSFGIIFVSLFKICNLRPLRRKLLMESESRDRTGGVTDRESWATQS